MELTREEKIEVIRNRILGHLYIPSIGERESQNEEIVNPKKLAEFLLDLLPPQPEGKEGNHIRV